MKKIITAGLSFAMAASMLAGCSSKPAENSDSGDKRVLKFDSFSGGNGEEVFTKLAEAFEKANPDVDVQLRFEKELPEEGYVLVKQGLLEEFRQKYGEEYVLDTVYTSNRRSCDVRDIIHILHFTKEKAIGNAETEERF